MNLGAKGAEENRSENQVVQLERQIVETALRVPTGSKLRLAAQRGWERDWRVGTRIEGVDAWTVHRVIAISLAEQAIWSSGWQERIAIQLGQQLLVWTQYGQWLAGMTLSRD